MRDYDFMGQHTIEDFDGHTWVIFYMDMSKFPTQENQQAPHRKNCCRQQLYKKPGTHIGCLFPAKY
jgi:hypothetical protein